MLRMSFMDVPREDRSASSKRPFCPLDHHPFSPSEAVGRRSRRFPNAEAIICLFFFFFFLQQTERNHTSSLSRRRLSPEIVARSSIPFPSPVRRSLGAFVGGRAQGPSGKRLLSGWWGTIIGHGGHKFIGFAPPWSQSPGNNTYRSSRYTKFRCMNVAS